SAYVEGLRSSAGMVSVDLGQDQSVPVSRRFASAVRAALVQRHRLDKEPARPRRQEPSSDDASDGDRARPDGRPPGTAPRSTDSPPPRPSTPPGPGPGTPHGPGPTTPPGAAP
ncbi:MAG TPA: hypothetical protein VF143_12445, partial [Candidatus Nanopelagicales bacterium]